MVSDITVVMTVPAKDFSGFQKGLQSGNINGCNTFSTRFFER